MQIIGSNNLRGMFIISGRMTAGDVRRLFLDRSNTECIDVYTRVVDGLVDDSTLGGLEVIQVLKLVLREIHG